MIKRFGIPPGIKHQSTQFASSGSWYDCNNIRFRTDRVESIGGWNRDGMYELDGIGRKSFTSRDFMGNNYQWVGTDRKFYIINGTDATDVTPVASTEVVTGANLFQMVLVDGAATALVKVTELSHGLSVNDWVVFTSVSGTAPSEYPNTMLDQYEGFQVFSVDDADNFTIYMVNDSGVPVFGDGSTTSWGTGYTIWKKISSGLSAQLSGRGWGAGVWGGETTVSDITTPFVTTSVVASATLTVTCSAENLPALDDYVLISGLAGVVDGVDTANLNGNEYRVLSHPSATSFTFVGPTTSGGVQASGGGSNGTFSFGRGWGESSEVGELTGSLRRVYMENYGQDMMMSNSGGPIYYYDMSANTSSGLPVEPVGDTFTAKDLSTFSGSRETPSLVDSFLISKKDGHCVALGCNDIGSDSELNAMLVRWADQNNPFDWGPSATNTSGGQILMSGSQILGGVSTKDEVIIFTDASVYSMRFIGPPDVFSFNLITDGVEIISGGCAVNASNSVFFMGNDGFYVYTGQVSPLDCPVSNYVFDNFNTNQKEKVFAAVNSSYSEVTWFYPSSGSFEPDLYVTFNYEERVWSYGNMDMSPLPETSSNSTSKNRTSWRDAIVFASPMSTYITRVEISTSTTPLINKSGVFIQEIGTSGYGSPVISYIETGDLQISDGNSFSFISRYIPDIEFFEASGTSGTMSFAISVRDWPGELSSVSESVIFNPFFVEGNEGRDATYPLGTGNNTSLRSRGRSASFKYSNTTSDNFKWRLGDTRLDLRMDGRR